VKDNLTSAVASTEGGSGGTASASLTVTAPAAQATAPIPTLSPFSLAVLAIGVILVGLRLTSAK
jgi:hypothetical protein